ncbi:MAG TPA: hypothetical protein VIK84_01225 [Haloplasmataceae bacterium]
MSKLFGSHQSLSKNSGIGKNVKSTYKWVDGKLVGYFRNTKGELVEESKLTDEEKKEHRLI